MRIVVGVVALALALVLVSAPMVLVAQNRHVAVIIDTSGSMVGTDQPRYTLQLAQILSDLLDAGDHLTVIRLPLMPDGADSCAEGVDPNLALSPSRNRDQFKADLDAMIRYQGGNNFAAPVRTAIQALSRAPDEPRLLLMLADSGGLGDCDNVLTRELVALRESGATIAAINLGGTAGAFDGNPAFDFTTAALDAERLVAAVARLYQRFLGAKRVQTGQATETIEVEIAAFVQQAFLVVAADGPIHGVELPVDNPGAFLVDLDHRGGGRTRGLDGRTRGYRIVRLERPAAGRWRFRVPGLDSGAGWMLLQDSSIGVRLISPPEVVLGQVAPIELELYDLGTGQRIVDPDELSELTLRVTLDGRTVELRDDGDDDDRVAGDGVFTAPVRFNAAGPQRFEAHLQGKLLDRKVPMEVQVQEAGWELEITTPSRVTVGAPVVLSVRVRATGSAHLLTAFDHIRVIADGREVGILRDDGAAEGGGKARDGRYTGTWTPDAMGRMNMLYEGVGGGSAARADAVLEVVGSLKLGVPQPIHMGPVEHDSRIMAILDLTSAEASGDFELKLSSDYALKRTVLEIDTGGGWRPLGPEPIALALLHHGPHTWPLRLRTGHCPEGSSPDKSFVIRVEGVDPEGRPLAMTIPLTVEVVEQSWLACWWPVIAVALGAGLLGLTVHGFWSPSRFPTRLGVVLSQEADMNEGFYHPIRAQKGSGSGFYRDARVYVCQDYRLSGKSRNAIARLRAHRGQVRIQPIGGAGVLRLNPEDNWEPLPVEETAARFGVIYRDEAESLFFELRNG